MNDNTHLLPEIVINLVEKYEKARGNEEFNLQLRLEAIRNLTDKALNNKKKDGVFSPFGDFKRRK